MKKATVRRRIAESALIFLALAGFVIWDNNALEVTRAEFSSVRLPAGFDGLVVVQLSDLHGKEFGEGNKRLLDAVAAQSPDLIAVTGDLVDENTKRPLQYAAAIGGALSALAPTYYVTGNHEWALRQAEDVCAALESAGVTCLRNQTVPIERDGERILLSGVDDPNAYADQKTPEDMTRELLEAYGENDFRLLLAHRNNLFATEYYRLGYDLTLAGHGHGGLIRLPFTDGLIDPHQGLLPSYTAGFYTVEGAKLFVSRGLGNIFPSARLFNRPEVAVLTLRRAL
ncbi:metallophosphoesterase [uncultured Oscillibacter sp.]|uniref:metallophosphoesterase n=1 Tax=uncultured Oscillibacter sp. TaxID=876091 RepID=UPI0025EED7E9|nr:metallophosphoesterase [uncultured Oscillibacter sp.]